MLFTIPKRHAMLGIPIFERQVNSLYKKNSVHCAVILRIVWLGVSMNGANDSG
jgi:hypothetical protein